MTIQFKITRLTENQGLLAFRLKALLVFYLISVALFAHKNAAEIKAEAEWLSKQGNKGFIENKGQMMDMDGNPIPFVLFKAEAPGFNYWITEQGITLQTIIVEEEEEKKEEKPVHWERIDIELKNAHIKKEKISTELPREEHYNYFFPHCPDGIYGVKSYEKITIRDVYPGIDWVFYRKADGTLKYDFVVHPGADYTTIELLYKSKTPVSINESGELELYTKHGNLKENTPVSFYEGAEVKTRFVQQHQTAININEDKGYETSIKFNLTLPPSGGVGGGLLVIDPQLTWSTFLGGNGADGPMSIDIDANGNVFVVGYTSSTDLPTKTAATYFQGTNGGGSGDAFILKFTNSGMLLWATYYGGNNAESANSVVIDAVGNVFVTGYTLSPNFPIQAPGTSYAGARDIFILKFDNAGNQLWATCYGGSGEDWGHSIAVDALGNIFVTGFTASANFPRYNPGGAYQPARGGIKDAFILKFNSASALLWASYIGGSGDDIGYAIATDIYGNIFITGETGSTNFPVQNIGGYFQPALAGGSCDAFIMKFSNAGVLLWSTYYGGSAGTGWDYGYSVATDASGNLFVVGNTNATDFPTYNAGTFYQPASGGGMDAFILKFNNTGSLLWATYYGAGAAEFMKTYDNIAIDACGTVYISFSPTSAGPLTLSPCDGGYIDSTANGASDRFITRFSNTGVLLWATYIGGNGNDFREALAVDNDGNLFVAGELKPDIFIAPDPTTYPLLTPGASAYYYGTFNGEDDGWIVKFNKTELNILTNVIDATCACDGSSSVNVTGGCEPLQYTWCNSSWAIIGSTSSIANLCPGNYAVIVNDTINCNIDTAYVTITASPGGVINSNLTKSICSGNSYTLPDGTTTGTSGIYTHTFVSSTGCDSVITTNLSVNVTISTIYNTSICQGQSINIHGVNQSTSGIYSQTYTAASGCDSISDVTLTVNPIISNTITINTCNSHTHNGQTYSTSGIYTQTLSSANGCDSILYIDLSINPAISTTTNISICQGQAALIHGVNESMAGVYTQTFVTVSGCDSVSSVRLNILPTATHTITINTCGSYTHNSILYTSTGIYSQMLIGNNGCDSTLTIELIIDTIQTHDTVFVCEGKEVMIHGTSQFLAGIYSQSFISSAGCDSISSVVLNTYPIPIANFLISSNPAEINTAINFTDQSKNATNWNWSFGDVLNSSSSLQHPVFIYPDSGSFTVMLVVQNNYGCSDTAMQQLYVKHDFVFYAPNSFTPNGDNNNDVFLPKGVGIDSEGYEFFIFDRWGTEIFKSTDINIGWEGQVKKLTNIAQIDVYTWLIKLKDIQGITHQYTGHVNLIR